MNGSAPWCKNDKSLFVPWGQLAKAHICRVMDNNYIKKLEMCPQDTDAPTYVIVDGRTDGWIDRQTDGWTDGQGQI